MTRKAISVKSEDAPAYTTTGNAPAAGSEAAILAAAAAILERRVLAKGEPLTDPTTTKRWLEARMAYYRDEVFSVLYLDNRHRALAFEELFRGTLDGTAVYPRVIVRQALAHDAAAVILVHNHPSGEPEPSRADELLTRRLKEALMLIDIRVLDHLVIGCGSSVSFAERGLL